MSRQKIRAANLRRLRDEVGTYRELARRAKTSEKHLSMVANETLQDGKPRMLGNDVADRLEETCDKHPGWFDIDHDSPPKGLGDLPPSVHEIVRLWLSADDKLRESIMAVAKPAK
jgi:hypothetical protein